MNIHCIYKPFLLYFRKKKRIFFKKLFAPISCKKILDVGGDIFNWSLMEEKPNVTILNIKAPQDYALYKKHNIDFLVGNGLNLPFEDNSFDIVYSNSTIEHLGTFENQIQFAKEIMRVGKGIFLQTPNKYFFIEPHTLTPFIHYLPKGIQKKLIQKFTIWGLLTRPSQQYCIDHVINEIRLLSYNELKEIFPNIKIIKEKFLFLTKSFYMYKG